MYDSQFHGTWKASAWYQNPKVDELLRKARGLVEQADRAPLYEEATRMIVADIAGHLDLQHDRIGRHIEAAVQGIRYCPVGSGCEVRWMSLAG